jgi:hypothetical protein
LTIRKPANDNLALHDDQKLVQDVAERIQKLYGDKSLPHDQALIGAQTLIGFLKTCVDIQFQKIQNQDSTQASEANHDNRD